MALSSREGPGGFYARPLLVAIDYHVATVSRRKDKKEKKERKVQKVLHCSFGFATLP